MRVARVAHRRHVAQHAISTAITNGVVVSGAVPLNALEREAARRAAAPPYLNPIPPPPPNRPHSEYPPTFHPLHHHHDHWH